MPYLPPQMPSTSCCTRSTAEGSRPARPAEATSSPRRPATAAQVGGQGGAGRGGAGPCLPSCLPGLAWPRLAPHSLCRRCRRLCRRRVGPGATPGPAGAAAVPGGCLGWCAAGWAVGRLGWDAPGGQGCGEVGLRGVPGLAQQRRLRAARCEASGQRHMSLPRPFPPRPSRQDPRLPAAHPRGAAGVAAQRARRGPRPGGLRSAHSGRYGCAPEAASGCRRQPAQPLRLLAAHPTLPLWPLRRHTRSASC